MELLQQFKRNWSHRKTDTIQQPILLAVSGGMDSMAMATLFLRSELYFGVAHCNFQLRGEEADKDEALVQEWCEQNNIRFHNVRFETKKKSEEWKKGTQETARILRYEWLEMIRKENGYRFIATAHHANDNVETLLMNLFKGTGISGMHGIPEQNGNIIRPLLFAPRGVINQFVDANNIPYRDDASNATDAYLRNAVRHHVIPAIEKCFPDGVQQASETIHRLAQAEVLYHKAVQQEIKKLLEQRGQDYYIPVLKLQKAEPLETICYELFETFGFSPAQIPQIIQLLDAETGHYVSSGMHRVIRNRDFLIITAAATEATDFITIDAVPVRVETGHYHFSFSIEDKPEKIPADASIACIDIASIEFPIILRKWHTGDYFYPLGMGMKKKKLSKYFIDQKVPLHIKEQVWVLECNKRIAWVAGMRLDERFKVKNTTKQVLLVKCSPNK